jgi:ABC-type branched-subunit amino acid transport system permease subunit
MAGKRRAFLRQYAAIAIFAVIYLAIGFLVRNSYYQLMMTLVLIWATMGLGWNMLSGYSGMISFGHAAFFGLGAYTVTIAFVKFGITPWLGIPLGVLVGVIAGVLIGIPTFRLRGHYFALSMLAYPLAMLYVFEWLGYQEVSLPMKRENPIAYMQFTDQRTYMVISMIVVVACMIISLHVERSRFGRSLLAIKQNQPAAEAAGINAMRWKMFAMMLSAGMAAAAGGGAEGAATSAGGGQTQDAEMAPQGLVDGVLAHDRASSERRAMSSTQGQPTDSCAHRVQSLPRYSSRNSGLARDEMLVAWARR